MDKEDLEKMLEDLRSTKIELETAYLEHVLTLTEVGAGEEVLEMLESEHEMLAMKINHAIQNAEFLLTTQ
jgi:hypothetical protein